MVAYVPMILWAVAMLGSLDICAMCVARGALRKPHEDDSIRPMPWLMVYAHLATVVAASACYLAGSALWPSIPASLRQWYTWAAWPSAVCIIGLIVAQLVLLHRQSRNAMFAHMDARLHGQSSRSA